MIVVEKNAGTKIDYTVDGDKVSFRDEMTLDLSKYERDYPVNLDICENKDNILVMGLSDYYVAQLEIPERLYAEEQDGEDEEGNPIIERNPVPFDMERVTLTLWAIEGGIA